MTVRKIIKALENDVVFDISSAVTDVTWNNANGTKDFDAPEGTWKAYWEKYSDIKWPQKCCRKGCDKPAHDGAHVYSFDFTGRKLFIAPLCKGCNHTSDEFELKLATRLVWANTQEAESYLNWLEKQGL